MSSARRVFFDCVFNNPSHCFWNVDVCRSTAWNDLERLDKSSRVDDVSARRESRCALDISSS